MAKSTSSNELSGKMHTQSGAGKINIPNVFSLSFWTVRVYKQPPTALKRAGRPNQISHL